MDAKGQQIPIHSYTYYWFVGYSDITPSHMTRTMFDLRDRILHGYNQRWAYVTVASTVTQGIARPERSKEETAKMIENFISELRAEIDASGWRGDVSFCSLGKTEFNSDLSPRSERRGPSRR